MSAKVRLDCLGGGRDAGGKPFRVRGETVEHADPVVCREVLRRALHPGQAGRHQASQVRQFQYAVGGRACQQNRSGLPRGRADGLQLSALHVVAKRPARRRIEHHTAA